MNDEELTPKDAALIKAVEDALANPPPDGESRVLICQPDALLPAATLTERIGRGLRELETGKEPEGGADD